jgi:hypothetical protein
LKRRSAARTAGAWNSLGGSKPTVATAVDQTPARGGAALTNARHRGVPVVLEKRLQGSISSRCKPRVELGVGATGGNGGSVPGAMRTAVSLTPFVGARALRRGSRPSMVWAL